MDASRRGTELRRTQSPGCCPGRRRKRRSTPSTSSSAASGGGRPPGVRAAADRAGRDRRRRADGDTARDAVRAAPPGAGRPDRRRSRAGAARRRGDPRGAGRVRRAGAPRGRRCRGAPAVLPWQAREWMRTRAAGSSSRRCSRSSARSERCSPRSRRSCRRTACLRRTRRRSPSRRWRQVSPTPGESSASTSSTPLPCCRSSRSSGRTPTDDADARDGVGRRPAPAQARSRRGGRARLCRQPASDAPVDGVDAGARPRGATFEETDEAALRLGLPMPPSALLAMVGPRVANDVLLTLNEAWPDRFPRSPVLAGPGRRRVSDPRGARRPAERRRDPRAAPRRARRRGSPDPRRGRRPERRRARRVPDPRRRVPVLPRRNHAVSRPCRRLAACERPPARRGLTPTLRPGIPLVSGVQRRRRTMMPARAAFLDGCAGVSGAHRGCCRDAGIHRHRERPGRARIRARRGRHACRGLVRRAVPPPG